MSVLKFILVLIGLVIYSIHANEFESYVPETFSFKGSIYTEEKDPKCRQILGRQYCILDKDAEDGIQFFNIKARSLLERAERGALQRPIVYVSRNIRDAFCDPKENNLNQLISNEDKWNSKESEFKDWAQCDWGYVQKSDYSLSSKIPYLQNLNQFTVRRSQKKSFYQQEKHTTFLSGQFVFKSQYISDNGLEKATFYYSPMQHDIYSWVKNRSFGSTTYNHLVFSPTWGYIINAAKTFVDAFFVKNEEQIAWSFLKDYVSKLELTKAQADGKKESITLTSYFNVEDYQKTFENEGRAVLKASDFAGIYNENDSGEMIFKDLIAKNYLNENGEVSLATYNLLQTPHIHLGLSMDQGLEGAYDRQSCEASKVLYQVSVIPGNDLAIGFEIKDAEGQILLSADGKGAVFADSSEDERVQGKKFLKLSAWNVDQGYESKSFEHQQDVCLAPGTYSIDLYSRHGVDWGEGGQLAIKAKGRDNFVFVSAFFPAGTKEDPIYKKQKTFEVKLDNSLFNDKVVNVLRKSNSLVLQKPNKEKFVIDLKLNYHVVNEVADNEVFFEFPYIPDTVEFPEDKYQRLIFEVDATQAVQAAYNVYVKNWDGSIQEGDSFDFEAIFYTAALPDSKFKVRKQINKSTLIKLIQEYLIRDSRDASNLLFNQDQVQANQDLSKSMMMPPSFFHKLFEGEALTMQIKESEKEWKDIATTLSIDSKGHILIQLDGNVISTL